VSIVILGHGTSLMKRVTKRLVENARRSFGRWGSRRTLGRELLTGPWGAAIRHGPKEMASPER
jgi:hypothetical protein